MRYVVPGPRPPEEPDEWAFPDAARRPAGTGCPLTDGSPVAVTRTSRGWVVVPLSDDAFPGERVDGLVEGMTLADLVAEERGALPEPDRTARRSARGPVTAPADSDPVDARIAALERTVAQLEHALAARVSTERAIGVLAERHGSSPRTAFETLRREARTQGRPVAELAREVLDGLVPDAVAPDCAEGSAPVAVTTCVPRVMRMVSGAVAAADGRS
ncbi:ANTAR domain-containing protein [Blastococcus capsensis]|uniref:ANTAR domain-containing protein n=1 Tax=Blastococcus capsensis TaxID=1564163 RepID=UPI002541ABCA|nr:ANTAR domain-containing protein [Blastococcus capsensis]MDK3258771.1 ANTAR domain-containing protein [Blastococcus capsensis]